MILTIDLGTSVTKVVVWGDEGPVATGRSALDCHYGPDNRAEQDPTSWWDSVVAAMGAARSALGGQADAVLAAVEALGFAAARQTFVPVSAGGLALGPALLWSDRRAGTEAEDIARSFGDDGARTVRRRTGVALDAGSMAAKVTWLERHEPQRITDARWLLGPRDLLAWRLTGEVATDNTLASATGLFELSELSELSELAGSDGAQGSAVDSDALVPGLVDSVADLLPSARPSETVLGGLLEGPAGELGLRAGIPVVIGAGDRSCEVLGTDASGSWPMVSWGTTANVSIPVPDLGHGVPDALIVTRGARQGWLLEGGLSAAGSLVGWLAGVAGVDAESLMHRARSSPPGAKGAVVLPWFGGARAPWWRDSARGALVGLSLAHDVGDMTRAVVESVAWDVTRCLEAAAGSQGKGAVAPVGLMLGGGGASMPLWTEVLTAVTGLPARHRRSGQAASAGAALLVSHAIGDERGGLDPDHLDLDRLDPVDAEITPEAAMVALYRTLRPGADAAAAAVIGLAP